MKTGAFRSEFTVICLRAETPPSNKTPIEYEPDGAFYGANQNDKPTENTKHCDHQSKDPATPLASIIQPTLVISTRLQSTRTAAFTKRQR